MILFGYTLLTFTTVTLGYIANFENPHYFVNVSIGLRFFQGLAYISVENTCYCVLCQVYSEDVTWVIRYIEIFINLGMGFGPVFGAILYERFKYEYTMYSFGGLSFIALLLCFLLIPNVLNKN